MYASQLAGVPSYRRDLGESWTVARVFWSTISKSRMMAGIQALRDAGDNETFKVLIPMARCRPSCLTTPTSLSRLTGGPGSAQKIAAMRAHATQITADGPFFAAEVLGDDRWAREYYRLIRRSAPEGRWLGRRPIRRAELALVTSASLPEASRLSAAGSWLTVSLDLRMRCATLWATSTPVSPSRLRFIRESSTQ